MKPITRRLLVGAAGALLLAGGAQAQEPGYPTKPIRIIVPFAPGGSVDLLARAVGQKLAERLGQSVIVDNRGGAGTVLGTELAAKAAPDGYTLLMAVSNLATNPSLHAKLPYDAAKDLVPISLLARTPVVIYANPAFGPKDTKELIDYVKKNPGTVNFGSGGAGTTSHLTAELLKDKTGISMEHVNYKGGALAVSDAMAGHIPISFHTIGQALSSYKARKLRALGVSSEKRDPSIPDVPTFREQGIDIVTFEWYGLLAPTGTPQAIVDKLNAELKQIVLLPETGERLPSVELVSSTPKEFGDLIRSETSRWAALIRKIGIRAE
jgi:tripartite-type tricarboxylate transporter receptor subunit TctC